MTALLSEDDGQTWPYHLLLDSRDLVTYPDAVEAPDGMIHRIYDHGRTGVGEIFFQSFTEEDVMAGRWITKTDPEPVVVSCLKRQTIGGDLIALETTELLDQLSGAGKVKDESHPEFEY